MRVDHEKDFQIRLTPDQQLTDSKLYTFERNGWITEVRFIEPAIPEPKGFIRMNVRGTDEDIRFFYHLVYDSFAQQGAFEKIEQAPQMDSVASHGPHSSALKKIISILFVFFIPTLALGASTGARQDISGFTLAGVGMLLFALGGTLLMMAPSNEPAPKVSDAARIMDQYAEAQEASWKEFLKDKLQIVLKKLKQGEQWVLPSFSQNGFNLILSRSLIEELGLSARTHNMIMRYNNLHPGRFVHVRDLTGINEELMGHVFGREAVSEIKLRIEALLYRSLFRLLDDFKDPRYWRTKILSEKIAKAEQRKYLTAHLEAIPSDQSMLDDFATVVRGRSLQIKLPDYKLGWLDPSLIPLIGAAEENQKSKRDRGFINYRLAIQFVISLVAGFGLTHFLPAIGPWGVRWFLATAVVWAVVFGLFQHVTPDNEPDHTLIEIPVVPSSRSSYSDPVSIILDRFEKNYGLPDDGHIYRIALNKNFDKFLRIQLFPTKGQPLEITVTEGSIANFQYRKFLGSLYFSNTNPNVWRLEPVEGQPLNPILIEFVEALLSSRVMEDLAGDLSILQKYKTAAPNMRNRAAFGDQAHTTPGKTVAERRLHREGGFVIMEFFAGVFNFFVDLFFTSRETREIGKHVVEVDKYIQANNFGMNAQRDAIAKYLGSFDKPVHYLGDINANEIRDGVVVQLGALTKIKNPVVRRRGLSFLFGILFLLASQRLSAHKTFEQAIDSVKQGEPNQVLVIQVGERGPAYEAEDLRQLRISLDKFSSYDFRGSRSVVVAVHGDNKSFMEEVRRITSGRPASIVNVTEDMKDKKTGLIRYEDILAQVSGRAGRYGAVRALLKGGYGSCQFITISKTPHLYTMGPHLAAVWTLIALVGPVWVVLDRSSIKLILNTAKYADKQA
jgi:hypothetical protein